MEERFSQPLPDVRREQPLRMMHERRGKRWSRIRQRRLIQVIAELRAERQPPPCADRRAGGEMPAEDRPDLAASGFGVGGFLPGMTPEFHEWPPQFRDLRSREKTPHPEVVVEGEMVACVEGADALPQRAPGEQFGLWRWRRGPERALEVGSGIGIGKSF